MNEATPLEIGSNHAINITGDVESGFSCFICRIERDGEERVINGFARHFVSVANAMKSATKFMQKHNIRCDELAKGVQS